MNLSQATGIAMLAGGLPHFNGGTLTFYSGTMPTTPETALAGNTALVAFSFAATAFPAPTYSNPVAQSLAILAAATVNPTASGTATFARAVRSDGSTVIADYTVGVAGSGADIIIGNTGIQTGVPVTVNSFAMKLPAV